ncbi:TdeIII family type II restriction endonuclease [Gammaproteobacteria bacterium]|nr:TdeIII family type II restriction endonuclease [Gammaproteobacteria bacterium]
MKNIGLKNKVKEFIENGLGMDARIQRLQKAFDEGEKHPFYISLFDENAAFSAKVTHSVYTWIGQSFYEPFCVMLGDLAGYEVKTQKKVLGSCNQEVENYLQSIEKNMDYVPNRDAEIKKLKEIVTPGNADEHPDSTVDVYITTPDKKEILIDITTVGNNKKSFRALKQKTLRWTAMRLSQDKNVDVNSFFAVPYNPYSTKLDGTDYDLWSEYYDRKDILVGDELWKKVSNNLIGINDIDKIFKEVGKELKKKIK